MKKLLLVFSLFCITIIVNAQNYRGSESVIQGAFNNNGQVGLCMLKYSGGRVMAYATTKNYVGQ